MATRAVGLDVGTSAVRAAEVVLGRDQPTMTRDLNGVFTGERGWSAVEDNNSFVEPITRRIRNLGKCGPSRFLGPGMDEATPDFERAWS